MKLFPLEKSRLKGEIMMAFQKLKRTYEKDGHRLFSRACWNGTRGNGFRLKEDRLDIRKMFFAMRMIKYWTRLRREVVDISCLETFN